MKSKWLLVGLLPALAQCRDAPPHPPAAPETAPTNAPAPALPDADPEASLNELGAPPELPTGNEGSPER